MTGVQDRHRVYTLKPVHRVNAHVAKILQLLTRACHQQEAFPLEHHWAALAFLHLATHWVPSRWGPCQACRDWSQARRRWALGTWVVPLVACFTAAEAVRL